jgi:parallel beta-helix repeat protein
MTKKSNVAIIVVCILVLGAVSIKPIKAQYQGNITITANGSINPLAAPIQQTGNTYTLTSNINGQISVSKNNILLDGNSMTLAGGLLLKAVSNATVKNFSVTGGAQIGEMPMGLFGGIYLEDTSNVVIANNTITEVVNFVAVYVYYETVAGIIVSGGHSNTISGNRLIDNFQGMEFRNTAYNLIVENSISYSSAAQLEQGYANAGIFFDDSSNNSIYHNNFEIGIGNQAGNSYNYSINVWDNGYPAGGNYWMNYRAEEIDSSGIGNKPHVIDQNNTDRYPLTEHFNSTFFALQLTPPKISIASPINQTYIEPNVTLAFSIDVFSSNKTVSWIAYCLDGQQNITITSNTTIANMANGLHDIIVYANDTFGNMGASQTISFTITEKETIPTIAVVAVSGAIAVVVVAACLLVYLKKHKHKAG